MTLSAPDFRARANKLLDISPPDATAVVASTGPDGHLMMHMAGATPHCLVIIARALLSQAEHDLESSYAGPCEIQLLGEVKNALSELPDDDEGEAG